MGCGFNRSMQHLISKYKEEDVETAANSGLSAQTKTAPEGAAVLFTILF